MKFVSAAAVAVALIASPALAAEDTVTVRVRTADLNLQTQDGAQVALTRITKAVRNACSVRESGHGVRYVDQTCVTKTTATAVASIRAPLLQALYEAKTGTARQG